MTPAAKLDPLKTAAQIGHGAAVNVLLAFGAGQAEAELWMGLGQWLAIDAFDAADRLATTFVADDSAPATGERCFRESCELRLHRGKGQDWPHLVPACQLAFETFGKVAHAAHAFILSEQARQRSAEAAAAAMAKRRKGKPLAITIFEKEDAPGAREPYAVKSLAEGARPRGAAALPSKPAAVDAQEARTAGGATGTKNSSVPKITIGERPIDMARQRPARHGGKREKTK